MPNWKRNGFPDLAPGARSARQFEGFVYVDGQLGRANQDVIRFHFLGKLENVSKQK